MLTPARKIAAGLGFAFVALFASGTAALALPCPNGTYECTVCTCSVHHKPVCSETCCAN